MSREDTFFKPLPNMIFGEKSISFETPHVMGIINLTPDSFYTESRAVTENEILKLAEKHVIEGATFLDLGAASSRPGAELLSPETEIERIGNTIQFLKKRFPKTVLSIDTYHAKVAAYAIDQGIDLVNDITGGEGDAQMLPLISSKKIPYIAMHMRGTPQTMQSLTQYENPVTEVLDWLLQKSARLLQNNIEHFILDPGIGFAKNAEQNFQIIAEFDRFKALQRPLLIGISRKSFIYKSLGTTPEQALPATTALHLKCLEKGANILRVHDVAEAVDAIKIFQQLQGNDLNG